MILMRAAGLPGVLQGTSLTLCSTLGWAALYFGSSSLIYKLYAVGCLLRDATKCDIKYIER